MIFLILTREGYAEISLLAVNQQNSIWINGDVLSTDEIAELRAKGIDVTNFTEQIDPTDMQQVFDEVYTISEHNPGERMWVEVQHGV